MKNLSMFQDSTGKFSSARFIFVIGSIWAMALTTILALSYDIGVGGIIAVYTSLQGTVATFKISQNSQEKTKNTEIHDELSK